MTLYDIIQKEKEDAANLKAEDYRYGYRHTAEVNGNKVSVRKISDCGGWIDLTTGELYTNLEVIESISVKERIANN